MKNKTLKSVCALLLAAILVCTGLFLQAFAQTPEELYTYTKFGDGIQITKYNGNETDLVLPREIDGYPVMYLAADLAALQADTGFVPRTTFSEGIRQTIAWMRKEST